MSELGIHIETVARALLGEPSRTTKTELRYGTHGSLSIEIAGERRGTWYDFERETGGGVLDLLRDRKGLSNGDALDWLREIGIDIEPPAAKPKKAAAGKWKFITDYHYHDAEGVVPYRVCRWLTPDGIKTFTQEKANGKGGWIKGKRAMTGVKLVPYRLPELLKAIAAGEVVLIPEGEKDVENLQRLGFAATCNPGGAEKWPDHFRDYFQGADVVILEDNDNPGQRHVQKVASNLIGVASRARVLRMPKGTPEKGDISWHIEQGADADRIRQMLADAIDVTAPKAKPTVSTPPTIAGPFMVNDEGVFYSYTKDGEEFLDKICSRLDVLAVTHDEFEESWGRVLQFDDYLGKVHTWAMPMSLTAGDGLEIRQELLSQGLRIEAFKGAGVKVVQYITSARPVDTWLAASRIGWHSEAFVLPDETFGDTEKPVILQRERSAKHNFRTKGTVEEWREQVSRYCVGNPYLAFAVSVAFAGPLLKPMSEQGGGFHYRGDSSCGKSTCLEVAGSVCGGGGQNGYKTTWRATDNGLEGVAEGHCDTLLCIDEIGESDAKTIGTTAYMLANGQGKIRASKTGSARAPAEWRLIFLSSGEESLTSRVIAGGGKAQAGMEIRLADIPIRGEWGVLDQLHEFAALQTQSGDRDRAKALINHLKRAAVEYYGTAIRQYLDQLVELDMIELREEAARVQEEFYRLYLPEDSGAQVQRVAKRFALVAVAGQLATGMGITGWPEGEAMRAAGYCFEAWLSARGTTDDSENGNAIDQVRTFLEVHGASRFSFMNQEDTGVEDYRVVNRAGYKRKNADGQTEYLIFRSVFRNEVCKGCDHSKVEELLIERRFLAVSGGKRQIQVKRSAGYHDENGNPLKSETGQLRTKERFYCILPAILTES